MFDKAQRPCSRSRVSSITNDAADLIRALDKIEKAGADIVNIGACYWDFMNPDKVENKKKI